MKGVVVRTLVTLVYEVIDVVEFKSEVVLKVKNELVLIDITESLAIKVN